MPVEQQKLTLQEVITRWSTPDAMSAMERVAAQLRYLHLRTSPEYRPLVDQYLKVLTLCLNSDSDPTLEWMLGKNHPSAIKADKFRCRRATVDALDKQREKLRASRSTSDKVPQLTELENSK